MVWGPVIVVAVICIFFFTKHERLGEVLRSLIQEIF